MRRIARIVRWLSVILVAILIVAMVWIQIGFPRAAAPLDLPPPTQAQVERGRYLFEHVLACHDCHSERDWTLFGGPLVAETAGGGVWVPDRIVPTWSANITPHALRFWTDGEILRAMTAGVRNDGSPVHPLMPWDTYRNLTMHDARSVVAYLRTLKPVLSSPPRARALHPREFLIVRVVGRVLPRPYEPPSPVAETDLIARGKYLATIGGCGSCHGADLAGGRRIPIPGTDQTVLSANLTPHLEARISAWTEANFVAVFRSFAAMAENPVPAQKNTPMPWLRYSSMNERDLRALYAYLRTLPPVTRAGGAAGER